MNFFKKKETLLQNMTFMALMSAINAIISLLICFAWYFAIVLVLILPLTSLLVGLYCKKRYYILYLIVSFLLCFLITIYDPINTIFYIFPSLLSGLLMALIIKLKMRAIYLILSTALINLGFNYLFIPFIAFFYNQNVIDLLQNMLMANNFKEFYILVPTILFSFSLLQSLLTFLIIKDELKKFNYQIDNSDHYIFLNIVFGSVALILQGILSIYLVEFSYVIMIIELILFGDYLYVRIKAFTKIYLISYGIIIFINIFVYLSLYQYIDAKKSILLLNGFTILLIFDYIINYQLLRRIKKDKIVS